MRNAHWRVLGVAVALVLAGCEAQPVVPTTVDLNYEGLQSVASQRFAEVQIRPGVDFTRYTAVHVLDPQLEFRQPNRARQEFPLTEEQKSQFREILIASFVDEFTENSSIRFVDQTGPDVITMEVRVLDIAAVIPGRAVGRVGRGGFALDATGNVTFVLEISDSESGQILARGIETRAVQGAAMQLDGDMLTRWEDVDLLCDRWAVASRTGMEALLEFSGT